MTTQPTTYTSLELSPEASATFESGVAKVRADRGHHHLFINGQWRSGTEDRFEERNPAHLNEVLGSFAMATAADVEAAVSAARSAFDGWRRVTTGERIAMMARAADGIARRAGELAGAATLEVGKNRLESMGEVDEAVALIGYYAEQARQGFDLDLAASSTAEANRSVMRPFGVFGVIVPFNFPIALVIGPATAAMLAGNTVVVKPSPTTTLVSVLLAEVLQEAGLPAGVFNLVSGGDATGQALVRARGLDGLVFTGSYAAGKAIASEFLWGAGYARPCILEMGGKNPAIVTATADLEVAAAGIARSAFGLSGQKCSACSRVLVHADVHDALVGRLSELAAEWRVGDPTDAGSRLGPVHTEEALARYAAGVLEAQRDGRVAHGGRTLREGALADGYYVEPTVVSDLPARHRLIREEQFLPLVVVERIGSLEEGLARANDQLYGLTAAVYSGDEQDIARFLDGIEAGTVFVNRAAGATTGGWPGHQVYPGWKGSGSSHRGGLGPRYVQQFLREQGRNIVRL
jgi:1-pyrroline-5-carboxylate dehydrogenase